MGKVLDLDGAGERDSRLLLFAVFGLARRVELITALCLSAASASWLRASSSLFFSASIAE